jgi:hypothetical protein
MAIGNGAMAANTSGVGSLALGTNALAAVTTGNNNQAQGHNVLQNVTTGSANTAVGNGALNLLHTASGNTAVGTASGEFNITGANNVLIGQQAGSRMTNQIATLGTITGGSGYTDGTYTNIDLKPNHSYFTAIPATIVVASGSVTSVTLTGYKGGIRSGATLDLVTSTALGSGGAGFSVPVATITSSGADNVIIGRRACQSGITSSRNVYVGMESGQNATGTDNVFIGYKSGANETGSNKLFIDNTNTSSPLIYGEFDNNRVKINGQLEIQTKTPASSSATGIVGEIAWDADYFYVCIATNTWRRIQHQTW